MYNILGIICGWFFRNIANFFTGLRFVICFVFLYVVITHRDWTITMLALVSAAIATDFLDGYLARRLKIVSNLGGALDRLADKQLLVTMFLLLIIDGRVHISLKVITIPLAVVETALLIIWFMGLKKKLDVSTVKKSGGYGPGQIKMFLLSIAILLCLLNLIVEERWGNSYHLWSSIGLTVMFAVSLFYAVKSFLSHKVKYLKQLGCKDK